MGDEIFNYVEKKHSILQRMWNYLGFVTRGWPRFDDIDCSGLAEGELRTELFIVLDWKDRIRSVISGKIMVLISVKTDVPIAKSLTQTAMSVLPPDYKVEKE